MAQYLSFNLIHHVYINADMQNHVYLTTTPKLCLVDKCKGDLYNNFSLISIKCSFVNIPILQLLKIFSILNIFIV